MIAGIVAALVPEAGGGAAGALAGSVTPTGVFSGTVATSVTGTFAGSVIPTGSFAGTVTGAGDPYWANVSFLSGFNGADTSNTFVDESSWAATVTAHNLAQITTTVPKFGTGCLRLFNSGGDRLSVPDHNGFDLGAGSWTWECFARWTAELGGYHMLFGQFPAAPQRSWGLYHNTSSSQFFVARSTDGTTSNLDCACSFNPNTVDWYHIAVDYDSGTSKVRVYVDGVMIGSQTLARTLHTSTGVFTVGAEGDASNHFYGDIDELRITKGVARYASDAGFPVPVAAYPRS